MNYEKRFQFQINAMTAIKKESPASPRFSESKLGVLTEAEMLEADAASERGMSGEEFGRLLVERDQSKPIEFPRPLSEEHQRIIDLVRDHHQHTGRPLVLCESEHYVTLRIPKLPQGTWEGR